MYAKHENLYDFISAGKKTFSIPVYQRNYDWRKEHCEKLFADIEASAASGASHFVGAIVYVTSAAQMTWHEYSVIDGQQRITSVMLLLKAIHDTTDDDRTKEQIWDLFLTNKYATEEKYRLKLKPIGGDSETWVELMRGDKRACRNSRLWENYEFFKGKLESSAHSRKDIFDAVGRLCIVYIMLDAGKENPQLIFESINSTGMNLSKGDLIRNYLLMNCPTSEEQMRLHESYWVKIEGYCTPAFLPDFVRDYLSMKQGSMTNIEKVYDAFKERARLHFPNREEELLAELLRYAEYYSWFRFCQSGDKEIDALLKQFHEIKSFVAFMPLLWFFDKCFHEKTLARSGLLQAIELLLSYQYRRFVCRYSTNALQKTYVALPKEIGDAADIPKRLFEILASKRRAQTFPGDGEFRTALVSFDLYPSRLAKYTLAMIERHEADTNGHVELTEEITIEHVMPQTLAPEWRVELGSKYEQIHAQWLHTIGNLTLTGNNQKMGNDGFSRKKEVYKKSNLTITRQIEESALTWNEDAIKERGRRLAEIAVKVWRRPGESDGKDDFDETDYDAEYSFMDDIKVTGKKPKSYFFMGEEKPAESWAGMFVDVLKTLYESDAAVYEKLMKHDVFVRCRLAVPAGSDVKFTSGKAVEICPGYLTETHGSAQTLMSFMQIAIEFFGLQDEFAFMLRKV